MFTVFASLAGACWLVWVLRVAGSGPPQVEDYETACDALEGANASEGDTMQTARRLDYRDTSSHRVGPSAAPVRGRQMVRRASEGTGEAAYQRLARRTEEAQAAANDRVEGMFDNLLGEFRALREDVQGISQNQHSVERRMDDLELQINMTRDEVQRSSALPRPSQIASAKIAIKDSVKSPWGRASIAVAGVTSAIVLGQAIPKAVVGLERFWDFLAGREVPAITRPARAEVPKK